MKTNLPTSIKTVEEAKTFLTKLHANGEAYHPEDDAYNVIWYTSNSVTEDDCERLNGLMQDIYNLPGNDGSHSDLVFDPCSFLLELDPENNERSFE